jgi:hypothetical protein
MERGTYAGVCGSGFAQARVAKTAVRAAAGSLKSMLNECLLDFLLFGMSDENLVKKESAMS